MLIWQLFKTIFGAIPSFSASIQRPMQRHHLSPDFSPGKSYSGIGVDRSLPALALNFKNSSLIIAQTVCIPLSSEHVSHSPFRKNPVTGFSEQEINSPPSTLDAINIYNQIKKLLFGRSKLDSGLRSMIN